MIDPMMSFIQSCISDWYNAIYNLLIDKEVLIDLIHYINFVIIFLKFHVDKV